MKKIDRLRPFTGIGKRRRAGFDFLAPLYLCIICQWKNKLCRSRGLTDPE